MSFTASESQAALSRRLSTCSWQHLPAWISTIAPSGGETFTRPTPVQRAPVQAPHGHLSLSFRPRGLPALRASAETWCGVLPRGPGLGRLPPTAPPAVRGPGRIRTAAPRRRSLLRTLTQTPRGLVHIYQPARAKGPGPEAEGLPDFKEFQRPVSSKH